jgi:Transposase DDE domain
MMANTSFVSPLLLLTENPEAVLAALQAGWVDYLGLAGDLVTDEHVRFALQSGLLRECAAAFPDPRLEPEIPLLVLLTASVAGAFQGEYALSQVGCALHSPALLSELGFNVAWLAPGAGLSRRGTQAEALFHGDVLRKLLLQVAAQDRAAGRRPGDSLLAWWNETVGPAFLRRAGGGTGAWIRDVTKLLVKLTNDRYEGSEVAREDGKAPERGYKLGLLSSLLDTGRLLTQVAWDGLRAGDLPLTAPFVQPGTPMQQGDSLRQDRGLLDGAEITVLKRDLGIDVVVPLKGNMAAYRTARVLAEGKPHGWQRHPSRPKQEIQKVTDIAGDWESCQVELNAGVVRQWDAKAGAYEYWVFATTDLERSAKGIIRDYEARSECEEDHRQTKGPEWALDEYLSTKLVEILYHVLIVLFAYNLCQVYSQTEAGAKYLGQTKRARRRTARRRGLQVVAVAGSEYAVLDWLTVAGVLVGVEGAARERLQALIQRLQAGFLGGQA